MTEKYTCVIVDDESKAIKLLSSKLEQLYPNITVFGTYTNWVSALDAMKKNDFDLIFLDISMPQKNGLSLLQLAPELQAEVIFVTAHPDHALDAFNVSATGYVVKPIRDNALAKAVDKAIEHIKNKRLASAPPHDNGASAIPMKHMIAIPNNKGQDYFCIEDIIYFESLQRYTKVVSNKSSLLSSFNIGKFKEKVEGHPFFQVHRSFIINLNHVKRYETAGIVIMSNGQEIPVSKNVRDEFCNLFNKGIRL